MDIGISWNIVQRDVPRLTYCFEKAFRDSYIDVSRIS